MLSKISFVLGAVVLALDTTIYYYNDLSCSFSSDSLPSTYASCDDFLAATVDYCESQASYSDCGTIQLNTCSTIQFWVDQGRTAAMLECVAAPIMPTIAPTVYTCDDTIKNGYETDVDCGGSDCPACPSDCSGYLCGANHTLIDDPETVDCAGNPCTSSDLETCCEEKALCSTYTGCFTGDVLIANSDSTYCESTVCDTDDRTLCCTEADNCESFSFCDNETQYLKSNPENLLCSSEVCDSSDISKCCEDKADCSAYTCSSEPDKLTYRENYTDFYCALRECFDTDSDVCCSTRASCTGFICDPNLYLDKSDKESEFCLYLTCEDSDWARCCDKRQACKSDWPNAYTYSCSVNELDENAYCAGTVCSAPDDDVNCCPSSQPFCDSNACNLNVSVVNTTAKCTADPCTSSDTQCCLDRMSCVDITGCSSIAEYVDENAYCAGVECISSDNSVCCVPKANCTNLNTCDLTSQNVNVAAYCATQTCESTDASTCCINKASCSDYDCDLSTQSHLSSNYCEMDVCDSLDVGNCCLDLASCTGFQYCSEGQKLDETAMCMADSCTEANDVANCCIDLAKCDSYSCTSTEVLIKNANETYCAGVDCEASDNCCAAKARCSTYDQCEICDKQVMDEYCADTNCTSSDYDTCCTTMVSELDDSKGVIMRWNVALDGDISVSDHEIITETIANYLNLPCNRINGSYTSSGSSWDSVYEIFVSTDGNDNAGTELETDLNEVSTIDGLKAEIASNLGVSSISFSTVSLSSQPYERSSGSSSDGLFIGIGVGVGVVLIIGGVVAWYKYNQRQKSGMREKVSDVFEM